MDVSSNEPPAAVTQQKPPPARINTRPPLVTSEKSNVVLANGKSRSREIASRYKSAGSPSPATPRRSSSPIANRTAPPPGASTPKRAQSAERKRPSTPSSRPSTPSARPSTPSARPSTPSSPSPRSTTPVRDSIVETRNSTRLSVGGRDGLWPSMRSLSSSFQSESSSPLVSKRDRIVRNPLPDATLKSSANALPDRRRSPLRGRNVSDQSENSRPVDNSHMRMIDQHRWPGIGKMSAQALSKSVDLTDRGSRSGSLFIPTRGVSPSRRMSLSVNEAAMKLSSEGSKIVEREASSGVNVSSHPSDRALSASHPSRTQSLPVPAFHRPSSPSKALAISSSTSRGLQSPSRTRPSTPVSPSRTRPSTPVSPSRTRPSTPASPSQTRPSTPFSPSRTRPSTPASPTSSPASRTGASSSVFNYIADVRTGKRSPNHMEDAHQLRLLYNRDLQWHFVNAQADASLSTQKIEAENSLYNVWSITSELHDSVTVKRVNLQKLKQELMLDLVLNEQITYLEEWTSLEKEHSSSLSGAIEALKASTLRLPVTGRARADVRAVKNAVSSAVDVMQAMGSSICYLLSRVEGTNRVVSELGNVAAKERAMLDECRELLASTAAMQVQVCSLRAHVMQLRQDVA